MSKLQILPVFAAVLLAACSTSTSNPDPTPGTGGAPAPTTPGAPATGTPKMPGKDDTVVTTPFIDPTNDPNAKPCTGAPGSIYALSAKRLSAGDTIPLCRFEGSVMMIVNTASFCGNTPQYAPLEAVYEKYRAQGFYILGFPSPDFGGQEYSTDQEVTAFCTNNYHISFPMFAIGAVKDPAQPVYTWLKGQPGQATEVAWNFEKWLISRHGQIVKRVDNGTFPDTAEVVAAIEAEIAKK